MLKETPDYYERLRESYDENFFRQEALGEYLNRRSGQVYCAFDRRDNVGEAEVDPGAPLLWSWDFNINPMASVICQERDGKIAVVDEIVLGTSSTPEVCAEFLVRYGAHRAGLTIYGDASGGNNHTVNGSSDYDLIRKFFRGHQPLRGELIVPRSNPPVRERINATNSHPAKRSRRLPPGSFPEMQGVDQGSRGGLLQARQAGRSTRSGIHGGRTFPTRSAICCGAGRRVQERSASGVDG